MREVLANRLWIGNAHDIRPWQVDAEGRVEAIVDLAADEPIAQVPRDMVYVRLPLTDGEANPPGRVRLAIATVAGLLADDLGTLVCCSAGMSRSPAIAAAAIAIVERLEVDVVLNSRFSNVPHDFSPGFWQAVVQQVGSMKPDTELGAS